MQFVLVGIGSVLAIMFLVQMVRGKKYDSMVENLDSNAFPLNSLYIVGLMWNQTKPFMLKGKSKAELESQASMLYSLKFAEYYAHMAWVQMLTLVHLFAAVTFLLAGIMYENAAFMLLVGSFMCVLIATYSLENMKNTLSARTKECDAQLPEVVSTMAVLVNSGMVLREAWNMVAENGKGALYLLMKNTSEDMRNGSSDADAILQLGMASNSVEIKKFSSALVQSMEKGGAELSEFLARQSSELWNTKRQRMLQNGEKAATKLLLPIVLIFIGIIIIVMTAAFAGVLF